MPARVTAAVAVLLGLLVAVPTAIAGTPVITPQLQGTLGAGGWYVSPVTITWSVGPPPFTIDSGCVPATLSQDTKLTVRACVASNADGTTSTSRNIKIDQTPPAGVAAVPSRAPDRGGWYVSPLGVTYSGSDATSGLDSCTATTYAGPDSASAAVAGTCRDVAGNVSAPVVFPFLFDATAPAPPIVTVTPGDRAATIRWTPSPDTTSVAIDRSPGTAGQPSTRVYQGADQAFADAGLSNGVAYAYRVTALDAAGNASAVIVTTTPKAGAGALSASTSPVLPLAPAARTAPRVARPPLLRWRRMTKASYYNVQLFRGDRKIMSSWPRRSSLQLKTTWTYRGHRHRLVAGRYRWYVWPGYGKLGAHRYGRLLGRNTFVVTAP